MSGTSVSRRISVEEQKNVGHKSCTLQGSIPGTVQYPGSTTVKCTSILYFLSGDDDSALLIAVDLHYEEGDHCEVKCELLLSLDPWVP